jgi:hypothetical protein
MPCAIKTARKNASIRYRNSAGSGITKEEVLVGLGETISMGGDVRLTRIYKVLTCTNVFKVEK